jgi:hypothetical protein
MWEENANRNLMTTIQAFEAIPFETRSCKRLSVGFLPMQFLGEPQKSYNPLAQLPQQLVENQRNLLVFHNSSRKVGTTYW